MITGPANKKIVVWLIEDQPDTRRVVARALNNTSTMQCACAFASCEAALAALRSQPPPEVILLDGGLPCMRGIEGISAFKALAPATHIIMLTVFDDQDKVFKAICAGASGYLLKSADEDVFCLRVIGDSMIEKGIYENDIVFVRKQNTADDGNIVIALLENEATVKIFKRDRSGIYLKPANRMYPNITRPFMILGKVISLKRDYTAF